MAANAPPRPPKSLALLSILALGLWSGCPGPPGPPPTPSGFPCQTLFADGGVVGTGKQAVAVASRAATLWKFSLRPISAQAAVGSDGVDHGGDWLVHFDTPGGGGLATALVRPDEVIVTGICEADGGIPALAAWSVDSPAAVSLALDAGCRLPESISLELMNQTDPRSPFAPTDPAWLVGAVGADGGYDPCVIDAVSGAFGMPLAGLATGGPADGGVADGGPADGGPDAG